MAEITVRESIVMPTDMTGKETFSVITSLRIILKLTIEGWFIRIHAIFDMSGVIAICGVLRFDHTEGIPHIFAVIDKVTGAFLREENVLVAMECFSPHLLIKIVCPLKCSVGTEIPLLHSFPVLILQKLFIADAEGFVTKVTAEKTIMTILAVVAERKIVGFVTEKCVDASV